MSSDKMKRETRDWALDQVQQSLKNRDSGGTRKLKNPFIKEPIHYMSAEARALRDAREKSDSGGSGSKASSSKASSSKKPETKKSDAKKTHSGR